LDLRVALASANAQLNTATAEHERLSGQITQVQERTAALEGLRERLLTDLASEREGRQHAAAEAAALTTLVAEQRALVQAIQAGQAGTRRPPRSAAVLSPAPGRHRRTPAASAPEATPAPASSTARRKVR
jgi:hypothetical protein